MDDQGDAATPDGGTLHRAALRVATIGGRGRGVVDEPLRLHDRVDAGGFDVLPRLRRPLGRIAMLPDELRPEAGVMPWGEWQARPARQAG